MAQSSGSLIAQAKQDRLERLQAEYLAISRQLKVESSPRVRVQLEGQLVQLEEDMAELESQLRQQESAGSTAQRPEPAVVPEVEDRQPKSMRSRWLVIAALAITVAITATIVAVAGNREPRWESPGMTAAVAPAAATLDALPSTPEGAGAEAPANTPRSATETPVPPTPTAVFGTIALTDEGALVTGPLRMELVRIPKGLFEMGSDPARDTLAYNWEQPPHPVSLAEFYIGKYEVTNEQYAAFVETTGHEAPYGWEGEGPPSGKEDHPVVYIPWYDAVAFTEWLGEAAGRPFRLCTEAEWEKACRGTEGRVYPWGDEFDASRANTGDAVGTTTQVGAYSPAGDSPYGVADMAGNAWEWTSALYESYPYNPADGREDLAATGDRVLRGGGFNYGQDRVRCTYRNGFYPLNRYSHYGFRVCVSPLNP